MFEDPSGLVLVESFNFDRPKALGFPMEQEPSKSSGVPGSSGITAVYRHLCETSRLSPRFLLFSFWQLRVDRWAGSSSEQLAGRLPLNSAGDLWVCSFFGEASGHGR